MNKSKTHEILLNNKNLQKMNKLRNFFYSL